VVNELADHGLRLHPDTVRELSGASRGRWNAAILALAAAIALAALAVLWFDPA
jgi:hypothetical protein